MVVLAYNTTEIVPGINIGYSYYTGQVDADLIDSATLDIGQLVYDELQTLPPAEQEQYGYSYIWKCALFLSDGSESKLSMFASNPNRYKIGHLTANSNAGTVWDETWKFLDQITPIFRGNFYTDNPNPGDGFPFGTLPLGSSQISVWRAYVGYTNPIFSTQARASYLNTFLRDPTAYIARISYTAFLSFTGLDIVATAPKPFVVVYP